MATAAQTAYLKAVQDALARSKSMADEQYAAEQAQAQAQADAAKTLYGQQYDAAVAALDADYGNNQTQLAQKLDSDIKTMNQNVDNNALSRGMSRSTVPVTMSNDGETTLRTASDNTLAQLLAAYNANKNNALSTRDTGITNASTAAQQALSDALLRKDTAYSNAQGAYDTGYANYLAQLEAAAKAGSGSAGYNPYGGFAAPAGASARPATGVNNAGSFVDNSTLPGASGLAKGVVQGNIPVQAYLAYTGQNPNSFYTKPPTPQKPQTTFVNGRKYVV